jgi:ubiquinone biosynthesis protein
MVPMAAASIAQVHGARLKTGEAVVVKIQRPGLQKVIVADVSLMRYVAARLAAVFPEIGEMEPLALVDAFEKMILEELDFRNEARNAVLLAGLLRGAKEVRVPRVYQEFTVQTAMVMEWVKGCKIGELPATRRQTVRAHLLRAFSRQILDFGTFHADPHPGNVIIEDNDRLVLLDLGSMDHIQRPLKRKVVRVGRAMLINRAPALARAALALCPARAGVEVDQLQLGQTLVQMVASLRGKGKGALILQQMVAIGREYRLSVPPALLSLVRTLATLDGVVRYLDPHGDLIADLRGEFVRSTLRRMGLALRPLFFPLKSLGPLMKQGWQLLGKKLREWGQRFFPSP